MASLGSIANEVSTLYGLKSEPILDGAANKGFSEQRVASSLDQFYALRTSAMSGVATMAVDFGTKNATLDDWMKLASAPSLWPLEGPIMSTFGERTDPFNGEGAFHRGIDIHGAYGQAIFAPADGTVQETDIRNGYGKTVVLNHGHGYTTLFGHMSGFAVTAGQHVQRGDVIGYVGQSGRSTGPHVHYEVHINDVPVNPHKYMRATLNRTDFTRAD